MRIAIGSVLKPLNDIRHYHKIALTLIKIPGTEIVIFARQASEFIRHPDILFKSIFPSKPGLIQRMLSPYRFFFYLLKFQPKIVIVCTHELLIPAGVYKLCTGSKLIYDIQENYSLNIKSNQTYNLVLKSLAACWIRLKEKLTAGLIDRFWLAEKCYVSELPFISNKAEIFENKSLLHSRKETISFKNYVDIVFIFSGTIAIENGILEAIDVVKKLNQIDSRYSLRIIGCCHSYKLKQKLEKIANTLPCLFLNISSEPIDYLTISKEIANAHIGIVSYRQQTNFIHKIPTKLYEYLSFGMPVLLQKNVLWENLCQPYTAAILTDFTNADAKEIHNCIQTFPFYNSQEKSNYALSWASCEEYLINSIKLLPK